MANPRHFWTRLRRSVRGAREVLGRREVRGGREPGAYRPAGPFAVTETAPYWWSEASEGLAVDVNGRITGFPAPRPPCED